MRGRPRSFDHDECRRLRSEGWLIRELAGRFHVSENSIQRCLNPTYRRSQYEGTRKRHESLKAPCVGGCGVLVWNGRSGLCLKCSGLARRTAEHGTEARYATGCRCAECRAASAAARRAHRDANREATRAYDRARYHAKKRAA